MATLIASGMTVSVAAGAKSADLVTGRNQYIQKGRIQLAVRASAAAATGMRCTLNVGGIALVDDQLIPFTGTTGGLSVKDHMLIDQAVAGGRVEFFLRNETGGALTADYSIWYTP